MEKKEWRELIEEIYHQHIAPKMRPMHKMFHPFEWMERYPHYIDETIRATRTIRFIEETCGEQQEVFTIFQPKHVKASLQGVRNGAEFNRHYLVDTGLVETLDEFMAEIVSGMEVSDLPNADFQALRECGSQNPQAEARLSMLRLRKRSESTRFVNEHPSFRKALEHAVKNLDHKDEELPEESKEDSQGPKRRWFKGIGTIGRGTVLSLVDLSLLGGWWPMPLSPDTTIVGSVVSLTTGLGDILTGIGEMRGE